MGESVRSPLRSGRRSYWRVEYSQAAGYVVARARSGARAISRALRRDPLLGAVGGVAGKPLASPLRDWEVLHLLPQWRGWDADTRGAARREVARAIGDPSCDGCGQPQRVDEVEVGEQLLCADCLRWEEGRADCSERGTLL